MKTIAFEVPIYKYKVSNWESKKKNLLNIFYNFNCKKYGNVMTSPIDIKTNILSDEILHFEKEIGIELQSTEVWFQLYEKNMDHISHNHGPIGFSSVCFIEYDKKLHKPTCFISPFANNITGELTRHAPNVDEGDIIFFPSNLIHYAPINTSEKKRIIMSFNLHLKQKKGQFLNYE